MSKKSIFINILLTVMNAETEYTRKWIDIVHGHKWIYIIHAHTNKYTLYTRRWIYNTL